MSKLQGLGRLLFLLVLTIFALPAPARSQGLILGGAGAMHRSMAGASTAFGVDALGAQYWNPAAIGSLPSSEVVIGGEAIISDIHVGSTIPAGAFGSLGPDSTLSGYTRSDSGVGLTSGVGVVYREDDSPLIFSMGLVTLAGGGVNFPGDPGNPILAPVGPLDASARRTIRPLPHVGANAVNPLTPAVQNVNAQIDQINDRLEPAFLECSRPRVPSCERDV